MIITLKKMPNQLANGIVTYWIDQRGGTPIIPDTIITIRDTGRRFCICCTKLVKTLFGQGFCYPCFQSAPENAPCIVRPELCRAHIGEGRDVEWESTHHNQPHSVYIANSGGLKVGITRDTQVPTRWIDQGAVSAIVIGKTPNRYLSGVFELEMKRFMSDKTAWQRMVKGQDPDLDLKQIAADLSPVIPESLRDFYCPEIITTLRYPVVRYPQKPISTKLAASPEFSGRLVGIRGQYLILDDNRVLNVRNHSGHEVELTIESAD